jgi:dolichol-phosphate mannosyltransferase
MVGCPWLKAILVRTGNFTLHHLGRLPTRDTANGFRLFTRRVLDQIAIESDRGSCCSIELVVKCHRLHWQIGEVPAQWLERTRGTSRFQAFYVFATTYVRRKAVTLKSTQPSKDIEEHEAGRFEPLQPSPGPPRLFSE